MSNIHTTNREKKILQVICVMDSIENPYSTVVGGGVIDGKIYTVKGEQCGFSTFGQRMVDCYEFVEVPGLYEKGIFIPLSNIDEMKFDVLLNKCLKTKPRHKKYSNDNK